MMTNNELIRTFCELYGEGGEIRLFHSPGRVNLIGEHTDYNGGYVFPAALSMGTTIALRKRTDKIVRMKATDLPDMVTVDLEDLSGYKDLFWGNYQVGIMDELQKDGHILVGCDMLYDDTIPHGGGLSSSAAIEVATALAFATLSNEEKGINEPVNMVDMALIGQRAENHYIGVNCGIMDQFASAMGKQNHAIFLQCSTLDYDLIPLQMNGYSLLVANTNKKRGLADSKYNERRAECEEAVKELQSVFPDMQNLTDISVEDFEANKQVIKSEVVCRRAKHVVYENARVLQSIAALKAGDMETFGALMNASHDSLRDDYEVTGIELDTLVAETRKIDGVIGSRMTGAGFGGCTVTLAKTEACQSIIDAVGKAYKEKIGYEASFYLSSIEDGGHEIK